MTSSLACLASILLATPLALANSSAHLSQVANTALGLKDSEVIRITTQGEIGATLTSVFELAGTPVALQLQPYSVRAEGFQVFEIGADGVQREVDAGPVRTVQGELLGMPGSSVRGAHLDDGLYLRLNIPGMEALWMQPLASQVPNLTTDLHVLYRNSDILDPQRPCGSDLLASVSSPGLGYSVPGGGSVYGGASVAELGIDADYEYFLDYGSTGAVQNRIEAVIGTMNQQYESQVGITHTITSILVRTSSNQPYSSSEAGTLLNQFRNEWNSNQGGIQRDVAQLFSGKEINGGTIGIAWLGVICNSSYGYGMVQSDFNGNFGCATDLSAHELGHNWSADHCNCTSNTMNPYITCANSFSSNFTIPEISSHRDSRTCLDGGGGGGMATDIHVASIASGHVNLGQGRKAALVTVVVRDDLGAPVAGVTVTGSVSGDLNETLSGTTGSNGSVTMQSLGSKKGKLRYTFCVTNLSGASLPYDAGDNVETCDSN